MVKVSAWGSPDLQYLDMGVAGQKGWEPLVDDLAVIRTNELTQLYYKNTKTR